MSNYVVWSTQVVPHCFVLDELEGVDLDVELRMGRPCANAFPSKAVYTVDPEFPNNIGLADAFYNSNRLALASENLKDFVAAWNPSDVEYLPVTLLNHKSRPAGKYFILHPVNPVDALKPKESGAKWSKENNQRIEKVSKLVLDENKIDRSRLLFKLKYFYKCVLIRRDLAEAITAKGFTGLQWTECAKYRPL